MSAVPYTHFLPQISQKPGHRDYLFPFEYGLSYARFIFESMDLSYDDVPKSNLTVTLTIANVRDADGDDVSNI